LRARLSTCSKSWSACIALSSTSRTRSDGVEAASEASPVRSASTEAATLPIQNASLCPEAT